MTEPILFREILQSHQALSPRGWAIVFGALGLFFASFGLAMFVSGAWPVIGFLGLEIGGLYVGYRVVVGRARRREGARWACRLRSHRGRERYARGSARL